MQKSPPIQSQNFNRVDYTYRSLFFQKFAQPKEITCTQPPFKVIDTPSMKEQTVSYDGQSKTDPTKKHGNYGEK